MIDFSNISQNELKQLEKERARQIGEAFIEHPERNPILLELRFNYGYLHVGPFLIGKEGNKFELLFRSFDKELYLAFIGVPEEIRCKGIGTEMMKILISLADKYHYSIDLNVDPKFGVDKETLLSFYQIFGFVSSDPEDGMYMERKYNH
jgi:GNAT superfamily N-acetyltransferase